MPIIARKHTSIAKTPRMTASNFNILCRLTDAEKDFLGLRYGLEMTNDEIANMLKITPKAVSDRYARLLNKCRRIYEKFS